MDIAKLKNVSHVYVNGDHHQKALDGVNLTLEAGKFIVVLGQSGAGKSTLLNLLGGLDSPTEGTIEVDGRDISELTRDELADYRAATVGFVFQAYNLIPTLTVMENVALVKDIAPDALSAHDLLAEVGLLDHKDNFPAELSGGELRRAMIARSLINRPRLLVADEPTSDLDVETTRSIMDEFSHLNAEGMTVLIVSHDLESLKYGSRVYSMESGKLSEGNAFERRRMIQMRDRTRKS